MAVAGLTRFLELRKLAVEKKVEQQQREAEVWWQQPRGSSNLFTVPQPFSFEERRGVSRLQQQRQQQQQKGLLQQVRTAE